MNLEFDAVAREDFSPDARGEFMSFFLPAQDLAPPARMAPPVGLELRQV
jgi:hypothetical protein